MVSLSAPVQYIARKELPKDKHDFRSEFMRDRDRIFLSKAFRRLNGKTQIFNTNFDDHARNRLTHSLEVAIMGKTMARALGLDEELTEAIALGHDVGHAPFGHSGEKVLNYIMNDCILLLDDPLLKCNEKGFKHNFQSVRIMVDLERNFNNLPDKGLNLTNYTLYGILRHTDDFWPECECKNRNEPGEKNCFRGRKLKECKNEFKKSLGFYTGKYNKYITLINSDKMSWSFESFLVELCDEIAQRHHDLEDGLESKIITEGEVLDLLSDCFNLNLNDEIDKKNFKDMCEAKGKMHFKAYLTRFMFNYYVKETLENIKKNLSEFISKEKINDQNWPDLYCDLSHYGDCKELESLISFPDDITVVDGILREHLKNRIINSLPVQRMNGLGTYIIRQLFKAYFNNPWQLPDKTIYTLYRTCNEIGDKDICSYKFSSTDISSEISKIVGDLRNTLNQDRHDNNFKPVLLRVICDYISGMTDSYAIKEYSQLYGKHYLNGIQFRNI